MTMTTTTTVDDAVVASRRAVIDESGWGAKFHVIQPRNFTFWVMAFLFVVGGTLTVRGFVASGKAYTDAVSLGIAWFGAFALLFLWIFHRLDRYSSIPAKAKIVAFLFAGLVTTFGMAAINNDAFRSILHKTQGTDFWLDWSAGLTAPWSEEIAKALPVILLIGLAPRIMRTAFDGLIIGAISGLAFQVFEDVAYTWGSAAANFGEAKYGTTTLGLRTVLSTGHWAWSGVVGAGVIYLVGRPSEKPQRVLGVLLILSSMLFHFLWDSIAVMTGGASWAIGIYVPYSLVNLGVFIWVYRRTVARERDWARALLAPEVELGAITADELAAYAGTRKDRKHFVKARKGHRRAKHVLEGVGDLADEIADAYGVDNDDVVHARQEIARVRGAN
jgi:RsiW-degrading membrane proteinase PrsW (M82 family)